MAACCWYVLRGLHTGVRLASGTVTLYTLLEYVRECSARMRWAAACWNVNQKSPRSKQPWAVQQEAVGGWGWTLPSSSSWLRPTDAEMRWHSMRFTHRARSLVPARPLEQPGDEHRTSDDEILFIRFVGHDSPATLSCALKKRRRGQVNLAGAMAVATHSKTQLTDARVAGSGGGHR